MPASAERASVLGSLRWPGISSVRSFTGAFPAPPTKISWTSKALVARESSTRTACPVSWSRPLCVVEWRAALRALVVLCFALGSRKKAKETSLAPEVRREPISSNSSAATRLQLPASPSPAASASPPSVPASAAASRPTPPAAAARFSRKRRRRRLSFFLASSFERTRNTSRSLPEDIAPRSASGVSLSPELVFAPALWTPPWLGPWLSPWSSAFAGAS
mmetsp:Transcript_2536/g.5552  ORF Transcript_2536/g.5552 Transcript_2536/m.5552 type:complete len:219 (-) Transcript_2536:352-1008(-)